MPQLTSANHNKDGQIPHYKARKECSHASSIDTLFIH